MGKNIIGFRTWLKDETIFPYVCFGWRWDFNDKSTILDRIIIIAEFGEINKINLFNTEFTKRGSFYFQQHPFESKKMKQIMHQISQRSILYYFSKYGVQEFK